MHKHKEFLFFLTINEDFFFPVEKNKKRLLKSQILVAHLYAPMKEHCFGRVRFCWQWGVGRLLLAKVLLLFFFLLISPYSNTFNPGFFPRRK